MRETSHDNRSVLQPSTCREHVNNVEDENLDQDWVVVKHLAVNVNASKHNFPDNRYVSHKSARVGLIQGQVRFRAPVSRSLRLGTRAHCRYRPGRQSVLPSPTTLPYIPGSRAQWEWVL